MSKTFNNVLFVAAGVVFAQALGSMRSFLLARLIDPADYGIWTTAQLVVTLAPIACLGTVEALLKQVPYFRGKNDLESLQKVENSVFGSIVLASVLLSLCFLVGYSFIPSAFVHAHLLLVQITAAAAAIGFFTAYYYHRCTAYEDFKSVSLLDGLRSVLGFICVLLGAWKWGILGGAVGFLVSEVLSWAGVAFVCGRAHGNVRVSFSPSLMANAVRIGFPITIIWWIYSINTSIGRMTAISFLGATATGFYGVGGSIAMLFALVPNMIGRVFYPRVNAEVGANVETHVLRRTVVMPTAAIALLLPAAQAVIFFLLPMLYDNFLPKYMDGLACAQILILGAFFVGLIRNGANYLIAINMQTRLMNYVVASLVANGLGSVGLVFLGFGINGIAVAASLASALLALLIWKRVFVELGYNKRERATLYASFFLPFLGTLLAIGLVRLGFSFFGDPRQWPEFQMILVLGICTIAIMAVESTRALLMDLCARAFSGFAYRFRSATLK
jgi:O-antigen/teichoic acid export membrane protein